MNVKTQYCWIMTFSDDNIVKYDKALLATASSSDGNVPLNRPYPIPKPGKVMTRPYPPKPGKSAVIYTTPYPGGPGRQQTDDPEIALFAIDSTSLDIGAQVAAKMSHVEMAVIVGDLKQATEWINGEEGKLAASYATTISLAKIGNTG